MHFRLFDRPLIVDAGLSRMWITGQYDDYNPAEAYEGRVKINGSVGFCTVRVLDSNLPPGAFVYVDNVTKQVVVKWPKYTPPVETVTLLENGDFASGDTGSWSNTGEGTPFVIEPDSDGNMSMKFKSGFYGGHFSRSPLAPVKNVNRQITLTGQIAQGKSSKKKLMGGLLLCWFDKDRNVLNWNESNWVMSGGGYQEAKVIAAPTNPLTAFVCAQIHFHRNGQNYPGWADNIKWDHVWEKGYNEDEQMFVEVEVTDSLNNTARHRGIIDELNFWITSQPYAYAMTDALQGSGDYVAVGGITPPRDSMGAQGAFVSFVLDEVVKYRTYTVAPDVMPQGIGAFVSMSTEEKVKYGSYTIPADVVPQGLGSFVDMSTRVINIAKQLPAEPIRGVASFIKMEITKK